MITDFDLDKGVIDVEYLRNTLKQPIKPAKKELLLKKKGHLKIMLKGYEDSLNAKPNGFDKNIK